MKNHLAARPTMRMRRANNAASLMLAGALAACGGGSGTNDTSAAVTVPAPAPVQQLAAGTWVVMGSSTAAGAGAPEGKGWAALLQLAYGARGAQVANIAKGGSVSYEGLSASAAPAQGRPAPDPAANIDQALARRPVLLIVSYPTNDTALGFSVDETVNNLLVIRAQAQAAGVPVLLLSTQPRNLGDSQLAQLRAIDARLAGSVGACFVDVHSALAGPNGRLAPSYDAGDGVHLNAAGHQIVATNIQTLIDNKKCVSTSAP